MQGCFGVLAETLMKRLQSCVVNKRQRRARESQMLPTRNGVIFSRNSSQESIAVKI